MRPILLFTFLCLSWPAHAWNAAGHRLTALLAWEGMQPATRGFAHDILLQHPDAGRWREKAGASDAALLFAEAATWADGIRHDPRFHTRSRAPDSRLPPLPGFPDMSTNVDWHYVNIDRQGRRRDGQIDTQIARLTAILENSDERAELAWALVWLAHLVGDVHQPLHTGYSEDRGGNGVLVENPASPRQPFVKLHVYWDDLPGPSGLRGKKLRRAAGRLQGKAPPAMGTARDWLRESQQLLPQAYPATLGSVSFILSERFLEETRRIAEERLSAAGYRLGALLEAVCAARKARGARPAC